MKLYMEKESITKSFIKVITLTKNMKSCGENLSDQTIVGNIIISMNPRFNHIVDAI